MELFLGIEKMATKKEKIENLETLREGFRYVVDFMCKEEAEKASMTSYYNLCNKMIIKEGGQDIYKEENK